MGCALSEHGEPKAMDCGEPPLTPQCHAMRGGGSITFDEVEDLAGGINARHLDGVSLDERLEKFGMDTEEMKDDGNCQFRALAFNLFGDQGHHGAVRRAAVGYMRRHAERFSVFFETEHAFETYLEEMAQDRTWGDELTLFATVQVYNCLAHVITSETANWYLIYEPESPLREVDPNDLCVPEDLLAPKTGSCMLLSYISPIHYNALVPTCVSRLRHGDIQI